MKLHLIAAVLAIIQLSRADEIVYYQPEQVHLSYGRTIREIVVTWSTRTATNESIVEYGIGGMIRQAHGNADLFVDGGPKRNSQYIHRVTLTDLTPNSTYVYHCGSVLGWSNEFMFKSAPEEGSDWQPRFAIYGDMGNENAQSLSRLQEETQRGHFDAILHVGDFAYDMDSKDAKVGDEFMRQIEPIAAYVPYLTCPGNHEEAYNFSNYLMRFSMPAGQASYIYSYNIGPLHIISLSTELYYFLEYGLKSLIFQYQWLEEDLARANLPENRAKHPWIIVMGHRPMYCSTIDADDCTKHSTYTRVGLPVLNRFGMEKLFYDYGVDVEIWAHEHVYERLWPIYDYKVYNGSYNAPYTNPGAPVHFLTGSAGCREDIDHFSPFQPEWSAFRSREYGFTRMQAYNGTHLHFEQVADRTGDIIDDFWVIKDRHGAYEHSQMDWAKIERARSRSFH